MKSANYMKHLKGNSVRGLNGKGNVKTQTRIIIGGAGFAGIAAGKTLSEHGVTDIIIAEASGRIGGRVFSVPFGTRPDGDDGTNDLNNGKYIVDVGAGWIYGTEGNPVWELKERTGLEGNFEAFYPLNLYDKDGAYRREESLFLPNSTCIKMDKAFHLSEVVSVCCLQVNANNEALD